MTRRLLVSTALPGVLALSVVAATLFGWGLPKFRDMLMEQRRRSARELATTARSLVESYHARQVSGELTLEEAKRRAKQRLRNLRYGPDGQAYFWINDMQCRMVMHPYWPDLEGQDLAGYTDPRGRYIFREFCRTVEGGASGFVEYEWHKFDRPEREPKVSYVTPFEPWGWVLGTGLYVTDVEAQVSELTGGLAWVLVGVLVAVAALHALIVRANLRTERARVEVEGALRESEHTLSTLMSNLPGMVYSCRNDRDWTMDFVSEGCLDLTGYPPEALAGSDGVTYGDLIHEDDADGVWEAVQQAIREREPFEITYRLRRADGTMRWVWERGRGIFDDGDLVRLEGFITDVTERRRAEEALRESERNHRVFLENFTGIAYQTTAQTFHPFFMSGTVEEITGYPGEAFTEGDKRWDELIHADDIDEVRESGRQLTVGEIEVADTEYRIRCREGQIRWVRDVARGVRDEQGERFIQGAVYDITQRKTLEAQLRQAQKMEAVGQLAAGVAHDFNNQLTVVQGYADMLLEDLPEDDPRRTPLKEIRRAGDRARQLTGQLLAFGRKQTLRPEPLDLAEVLAEMEGPLSRIIGERVEVNLRVAGEAGLVEVDRSGFEQAMLNLVVNARDAMPEGGRLTIELDRVDIDAAYARSHEACEPGPHAMVAVSDTGHGMDAATLERVFEPFYTTKEEGKGTGLGLSMVYGFVRQSAGAVHVYSEPGVGTTFKLYFPTEAEAAPARVAGDPAEPDGGHETLLVAEDEEGVRTLLVRTLRRYGYRVFEAANAREALPLAIGYEGDIDLLVTDVVMPGATGPELAREARHSRPGMKVLYISGYTDGAAFEHGHLPPDVNLLTKPFSAAQLAAKVRRVLDDQAP